LLDHHLATFDGWLRPLFISLFDLEQSHYIAVVTLLDQLDLKEYNWQRLSVILRDPIPYISARLHNLFGGTKVNIEFSQIVSKFLMDRKRAGIFWVNSQTYADLGRDILEFLRNK